VQSEQIDPHANIEVEKLVSGHSCHANQATRIISEFKTASFSFGPHFDDFSPNVLWRRVACIRGAPLGPYGQVSWAYVPMWAIQTGPSRPRKRASVGEAGGKLRQHRMQPSFRLLDVMVVEVNPMVSTIVYNQNDLSASSRFQRYETVKTHLQYDRRQE